MDLQQDWDAESNSEEEEGSSSKKRSTQNENDRPSKISKKNCEQESTDIDMKMRENSRKDRLDSSDTSTVLHSSGMLLDGVNVSSKDDTTIMSTSPPNNGGDAAGLSDGLPRTLQQPSSTEPIEVGAAADTSDEELESYFQNVVAASSSTPVPTNPASHEPLTAEGIQMFETLFVINPENNDEDAQSDDGGEVNYNSGNDNDDNESSNMSNDSNEIFLASENSNDDSSSSAALDVDMQDVHSSDSISSISTIYPIADERKKNIHDITVGIMGKSKPKYTWSILPAVYYRQNGLNGSDPRKFPYNMGPTAFEYRARGSLHVVERLELMYKLEEHRGCVNSLNFNKAGNLLVSGSDDLKIVLWKWASDELQLSFESGHLSNIFQTKFLDLDNVGIDIVSSSRDGQIRHSKILPSGGRPQSTVLVKHSSAVNKLSISPYAPYEVLSAGEDGRIVRCDLRENCVERLATVRSANKNRIALYSIANHPTDPEFCVCGRDARVMVFDRRNVKKPYKLFCPDKEAKDKSYSYHITCAVYNYLGDEILASSPNDVFLFDTKNDTPGAFKHKYSGHRNSKTIKGVNFFGPRSEFIMSGSDCGNCYFWDKETEAIVQWMHADERGVVNCVESHPSFPIVATSGLDHDIKIWVPSNEEPSAMTGLKKCITKNVAARYSEDNDYSDFFDERVLNFYVSQVWRRRYHGGANDLRYVGEAQLETSDDALSGGSDHNSSPDEQDRSFRLQSLPCSPS